jgi:enamine deaminase RidA (YjgF/YER057c/UK114 family)
MNEVWGEWVGEFPDHKGVRACVESPMARPSILVEIQVIAALP